MSGFDRDLKDKIVNNYSHIIVQASSPIEDYGKIMQDLNEIPHIVATAPFIQGQALMQGKNFARGIILRGVDLALEEKVSRVDKYLITQDKNFSGGVFIGKELASAIGIGLGDELNLLSPKGKKFSLPVRGLYNSGMYDYDVNIAFVDLKKAQEIFELGNSANGISVRLDKIFLAESVKKEIESKIAPYFFVQTWTERNRNFFAALKLEKITMFIILTLIVLVASFNIIATLVVMVSQKVKDIGILKSIGMKKNSIRAVFTLLGIFIGGLGIAAGSGLGIGLCLLLKKYQFIKLPPDIYYLDKLPVSLELWPDVGMILIAAFGISLLSTIYPAKKAASLTPVEALRYE